MQKTSLGGKQNKTTLCQLTMNQYRLLTWAFFHILFHTPFFADVNGK